MEKVESSAPDIRPSETASGTLRAPVVLTPDQIQQIAAGTMLSLTKDKLVPITRLGIWPMPTLPSTIPGPIFTA